MMSGGRAAAGAARRSSARCAALAGLALLLTTLGCAAAPGVDLTILHVNDLHARLLPDAEGRGGFAYVATVLERERAAAAAHLTLHAGDMVQGSPVSTLFQGSPIFTIANGLGIDVHCLGNHDFDYGWDKVPEYVELSAFDTVSANLLDPDGDTLVQPYVVRQVGELRIAVVGAIAEGLAGLSRASNLGSWRAAPLVVTLKPVVEEAAAAADMVIVLGHLEGGEAEAILEALIETIMRDGTGAELAHMNRGGVRDILPEGELLARQVWSVMPFDNSVVTTEISGRQLIELHDTVLQSEPIEGRESLDPDRTYRLATTDFTAGQWSVAGIDLEWTDTGVMLRDMMIAWIAARELVQIP